MDVLGLQHADSAALASILREPASAPSQRAEDSTRPPADDRVTISEAGHRAASREGGASRSSGTDRPGNVELNEEEEEQVREFAARDREVRTHEQAHKAAAGNLASGGPTYSYTVGPDGKRYAVGGEVQIQLREGRTPEETLRNMQRAHRAANAPAEPSAQDRAVAAQAAQRATAARAEINRGEDSETDEASSDVSVVAAESEQVASSLLDVFA